MRSRLISAAATLALAILAAGCVDGHDRRSSYQPSYGYDYRDERQDREYRREQEARRERELRREREARQEQRYREGRDPRKGDHAYEDYVNRKHAEQERFYESR